MYNLLLVDDEPIIRRGIQSMTQLSDIGVSHTYEADCAKTALDVLENEHIDIVLLDINMPDTDGLTLAAKIKEIRPKIRIIMITGYDYFEYMQTAIRIGVDDYLLKPVSKTDVEQVLKRVVTKLKDWNIDLQMQNIQSSETGGEINDIAAFTRKHIFDFDFSLTNMANQLGFSSNYLSSLFKKHYGIPFQEYVGIKRMEQAKLLLLTRDMKNLEIADAIGYDDVNYFITKFKRTYGITPKQFRQGVLNNEI